jgi:hypothetical protein
MKKDTVLEILSYVVPIGLGIYVIKTALLPKK